MNEAESTQNMEQKCPQCGAPLPSGVLAGLCPACLMKQGAAGDTAAAPEAKPFLPPGSDEVARLFPQLEIIGLIGKGGMGAVYKARQPALDRFVALKILPAQTAAGPGFVERFNREARALARLSHPNIVAVHEFGQVNGLSYFIMEFVDGLNLRELERAGKLSPREALQIVPQICEALQFAHDEGIVHRDIKPENILIDKKGRVKIADFGIAKILSGAPEADLTQTQGVVGTPNYMAPEQMEKPTSVDHRADIFSLGVVFYEMLTGELPLGKFAPPSSRKVEVDVRLDDVVLRTLEKDPERRYQHASQVKTAVDTIVGSAAPPPAPNAAALAAEILAKDYRLNIRSCLRRSWKLLKGQFWPFVGITALFLALFSFASTFGGNYVSHNAGNDTTMEVTSGVAVLVLGPLWGGPLYYFLKKIRMEAVTVEMAFCGFSHRFLHLFLAGFVASVLIWIGFLLLVFPGIYLAIAWMFTLPIVVDKQVDFWTAMELSRKVVTRHWFKLFGFGLVLCLLLFAGVLAFGFGIFVMTPLVLGALMYAYEDIIGSVKESAAVPAATGPTGTIVMPPAQSPAPQPGPGLWTPATKIALGAIALAIIIVLVMSTAHHHGPLGFLSSHRGQSEDTIQSGDDQPAPAPVPQPVENTPAPATEPAQTPDAMVFGPVVEQQIQLRTTGTNQFLDLDNQQLLTPSPEIADVLAASQDERAWQGAWESLKISQDSHQYIDWLRQSGADLMYADEGKIIGFDGIFAVAHGTTEDDWNNWDVLTPQQAQSAVAVVEWQQKVADASAHHQPVPPAPVDVDFSQPAVQMESHEADGPVVHLLTRDQSVNWFFKTREGHTGVLQIVGFTTGSPPVATVRYKLIEPSKEGVAASSHSTESIRQALLLRLDAASNIGIADNQNDPLTSIARDAANADETDIARRALDKIMESQAHDNATKIVALIMAAHGKRREAVEMAKGIHIVEIRDEAMAALAR